MGPPSEPALHLLTEELVALRHAVLAAEARHADAIARVHPRYRRSAANLVHYVELRRHDVRRLQERLGPLGLSTLGRAEAHVLGTLEAVLATLGRLTGHPPDLSGTDPVSYDEGERLLRDHSDGLLGPARSSRWTRVMVTMPSEAAHDAELVRRFQAAGMDVARINCAHDDPGAWERMASHARAAAAEAGRPSRVAMDLAGPKLRTGPIEPGPNVVKLRPVRDLSGLVVGSWQARLGGDGLPVGDPGWLGRRQPGDLVHVEDARGARRTLRVTAADEAGVTVEGRRTTYLRTGSVLVGRDRSADDATEVGDLPARPQALLLRRGDRLVLTRDLTPVPVPRPGEVARIGCTLPEAFRDVRPGDRVLFDDGKLHGLARRVDADEIEVEITRARPQGAKLREAKGINLPDTDLDLRALTDKDIADLPTAVRIANAVQASFVRDPDDVQDLLDHLREVGGEHLGIILKIETVPAFERLPELLLTAMQDEEVGVMIARGDLAVEAGFERLAEVQEEILWLCEAAHVPVIWATEVLDSLARTGQPSRAEVTDAAMGQRAECVMLNKGPAIEEAIRALSDILSRMADHQRKKRTLLRRLHSWDRA